MEKYALRKKFIQLRIKGKTNKECSEILRIKYNERTLRRWWAKFNGEEWDLQDTNKTPLKPLIKFSKEDRQRIKELRERPLVMVQKR